MYYIINQSDQIVAIDPQLLSQLEIESADMFYQKVALHDIAFELNGNEVTIVVDGIPRQYTAAVSPLAGMLGDIRLVDIDIPDEGLKSNTAVQDFDQKKQVTSEEASEAPLDEINLLDITYEPSDTNEEDEDTHVDDIDLISIEDEASAAEEIVKQENKKEKSAVSSTDNIDLIEIKNTLPVNEEETAETEKDEKETLISFDDIDLFEISEEAEETKSEKIPETEEKESSVQTEENKEDELFELILPTEAENAINEIPSEEAEEKEISNSNIDLPKKQDGSPIYIDVERISEEIGISTDDYNLFLNEYIDTALTFEKALQSHDEEEKKKALKTLTHLSNVLHLPFVKDILSQIQNASLSERDDAVESFFSTLNRLTTAHFEEEKLSEPEETAIGEGTPEKTTEEEKRAPIDLSDIKPIHFDFQLEEAAKDLSLPVELIEEFVNDFIVQAHEETEKMIKAYENGDLETVQKIGHLLKGTSSNLRINPLSDTLYEIQFNDDIDRVPELVRNYWAHFLSLENQIKLISKK